MNYLRIYFRIIRKAKNENRIKSEVLYYEKHHIRPGCVGGSRKKSNLVLLTAKEHFICHACLAKHFENNLKYSIKFKYAFYMMKASSRHHKRYFNSATFENNKLKLYGENGLIKGKNASRYGAKTPLDVREKQSKSRKKYIKDNPDEIERLQHMALNRTKEHRNKIIESLMGQKRSDNTKKKMSETGKTKTGFDNNFSYSCSVNGKIYGSISIAQKNNPEIKNLRGKLRDDRYPQYFLIKEY